VPRCAVTVRTVCANGALPPPRKSAPTCPRAWCVVLVRSLTLRLFRDPEFRQRTTAAKTIQRAWGSHKARRFALKLVQSMVCACVLPPLSPWPSHGSWKRRVVVGGGACMAAWVWVCVCLLLVCVVCAVPAAGCLGHRFARMVVPACVLPPPRPRGLQYNKVYDPKVGAYYYVHRGTWEVSVLRRPRARLPPPLTPPGCVYHPCAHTFLPGSQEGSP
jgi:hypothetical protein